MSKITSNDVYDIFISYPSDHHDKARHIKMSLEDLDPRLKIYVDHDFAKGSQWSIRVDAALRCSLVYIGLLPTIQESALKRGRFFFRELSQITDLNASHRQVSWQAEFKTVIQPIALGDQIASTGVPDPDDFYIQPTRPWSWLASADPEGASGLEGILDLVRQARQRAFAIVPRRSDAVLAYYGKVALLIDDGEDAEPSAARALYGTESLPDWWLCSTSLADAAVHIRRLLRALEAWEGEIHPTSRNEPETVPSSRVRSAHDTAVDGTMKVRRESDFAFPRDSDETHDEPLQSPPDSHPFSASTDDVEPFKWSGPRPRVLLVLDRLVPGRQGEGPESIGDVLNGSARTTSATEEFREAYTHLMRFHDEVARTCGEQVIEVCRQTSFAPADNLRDTKDAFIPRKYQPLFGIRQRLEKARWANAQRLHVADRARQRLGSSLLPEEWLNYGPLSQDDVPNPALDRPFNQAMNLVRQNATQCYLIAGAIMSMRPHARCVGFPTFEELLRRIAPPTSREGQTLVRRLADWSGADGREAEANAERTLAGRFDSSESFVHWLRSQHQGQQLTRIFQAALSELRRHDLGIGMTHFYAVSQQFARIFSCSIGGFLARAVMLKKNRGEPTPPWTDLRPLLQTGTLDHGIKKIAPELETMRHSDGFDIGESIGGRPGRVFIFAGVNPDNPCIAESLHEFGELGNIVWIHPAIGAPDVLLGRDWQTISVITSPLAFLHDSYTHKAIRG